MCATKIGYSIPLLYPKVVLFPSIRCKMAGSCGYILCAISDTLLKNVSLGMDFHLIIDM